MDIENLFFDWKSQDCVFVGDRMTGSQRRPHANSWSLWLCYLTQQVAQRLLPADLKVGSLSWIIWVVPVWAPGSLNGEEGGTREMAGWGLSHCCWLWRWWREGPGIKGFRRLLEAEKGRANRIWYLQTERSPLAPWFQLGEAHFGFLVYTAVRCLKPVSCGHLSRQQQN